jgi:hypothetical protein
VGRHRVDKHAIKVKDYPLHTLYLATMDINFSAAFPAHCRRGSVQGSGGNP